MSFYQNRLLDLERTTNWNFELMLRIKLKVITSNYIFNTQGLVRYLRGFNFASIQLATNLVYPNASFRFKCSASIELQASICHASDSCCVVLVPDSTSPTIIHTQLLHDITINLRNTKTSIWQYLIFQRWSITFHGRYSCSTAHLCMRMFHERTAYFCDAKAQ